MKANDIVINERELLNTKIYNPEFDSIKGWLNNTSAELTDAAALASVRSGSPAIEVLVFTEKRRRYLFSAMAI